MDKTEVQGVIKYHQKNSMIPKKIHEDMIQIFAEDSPTYTTVKFKQVRNSSENDPQSGCSKTSTTDDQVDDIHHFG